MQTEIPLCHFSEAENQGTFVNLSKVYAIKYNLDYDHNGNHVVRFELVMDGGTEVYYYQAKTLQEGLAKLGISLSGLTIIK